MRVTECLPFLSHAKLLSTRYKRVSLSDLAFPRDRGVAKEMSQFAQGYFDKRTVAAYTPFGSPEFIIPQVSAMEQRVLATLATLSPHAEVLLKLMEVDYPETLQNVVYDDAGGAYFDLTNGSDFVSLTEDHVSALQAAAGGNYAELREMMASSVVEANAIEEAVLPRGLKGKIKRLSTDAIERVITNYVKSRSSSERVPVLFGNTAVAKSALVKAVAKKMGRRLVELRCAFLDRVDIEGFRHRIDDESGELFSTTAPPSAILTCTDNYIDYCRASVTKLEAKLGDMEPEQRAATVKVIEKLKFYATPPILFFDEITRASPPVQNAFVQILNQKAYKGMDMKQARIIGASNFPIELPPEFQETYLTQDLEDAGIKERYEPIIVRPQDVKERWFEYIEGPGGWDELIIKFLKDNPGSEYNIKYAVDTITAETDPAATTPEDLGVVPFPNFRTWEFVNDHIQAVRNGDIFFDEILVKGYIGTNEVADKFIKEVRNTIPQAKTKPESEDYLLNAVESAFKSNSPVLLMGMTSIGKTTRVKMMEKRHNAHVVVINLAQKDRVDVMGAPASVPVYDTVVRGVGDALPDDVMAVLEGGLTEFMPETPRQTIMMPDFYLRTEIDAARAAGQKVILFFDEINRADPYTMSAVLEAVSDQRFGGVNFPYLCRNHECGWEGPKGDRLKGRCPKCSGPADSQVIIMAACNYGAAYEMAGKLDPAIAGRFSVIKKLTFDEVDRNAVLSYMKEHKYEERVVSFLENMELDELVRMFSSVESRTLVEAAPSLRSFSDVSQMLKQVDDPALQGRLMDTGWERSLRVAGGKPGNTSPCEDFKQRLKSIPICWAGYNGDKISIGDQKYDPTTFVRDMGDTLEAVCTDLEMSTEDKTEIFEDLRLAFVELARINRDMREYRGVEFKAKFGGNYAMDFLKYYNEVTGNTTLSIEDLKSKDLIWKYAKQQAAQVETPDAAEAAMVLFMEEFQTFWGDGASVELYKDILRAVRNMFSNVDNMISLMMRYTTGEDKEIEKFFNRVMDVDFTKEFAGLIFVKVDPDNVETYYKGSK